MQVMRLQDRYKINNSRHGCCLSKPARTTVAPHHHDGSIHAQCPQDTGMASYGGPLPGVGD
ncbi:hypothetical protein JMJ77_0002286 [Colletotrichum scovillei]|uniref:Uncharacterized protein n=1 Tax=Colletotrichum scovillei TaxID=1209932 RepID=A0A9P7RA26_9PEZI|nr:hypothetical protein JMJ77_0002286 [Colletotrichum scovillei]KAG7070706.1 hypothetical protein JMJ76_0001952 [Colletotrichum scovillei]KAG7078945.1 hypothetical protein JMJ78_0002608 [Colletotrichum scovillei]